MHGFLRDFVLIKKRKNRGERTIFNSESALPMRLIFILFLSVLSVFVVTEPHPVCASEGGAGRIFTTGGGAEYRSGSVDDKAYFSRLDMLEVVDQMLDSWVKTNQIRLEAEKNDGVTVSDGSSTAVFLSVRYPVTRYVFYGADHMNELIEKLADYQEIAQSIARNVLEATCYKLRNKGEPGGGGGGDGNQGAYLGGPVSADWDCNKWDMNRIGNVPTGLGAGRHNADVAYMMSLIHGVHGPITSPWQKGRNLEGRVRDHGGIDIAIPKGSPLYAAVPGKVECRTQYDNATGKMSGYGRYVVINYGGYQVYYGHLDSHGPNCGQTVNAGDLIGYSGNTGRSVGAGGGYHLHYEIRGCNSGVAKQTCDPIAFTQKLMTDYWEANCGPNSGKVLRGGSLTLPEQRDESDALRKKLYGGLPAIDKTKQAHSRNGLSLEGVCKNCAPGNETVNHPPKRADTLPPGVTWDSATGGRPTSGLPVDVPPSYKGDLKNGTMLYDKGSGRFIYKSPDGGIWRLEKDSNVWDGLLRLNNSQTRLIYDMNKDNPTIRHYEASLVDDPRDENGNLKPDTPVPTVTDESGNVHAVDACDELSNNGDGRAYMYAQMSGLSVPTVDQIKQYTENLREALKKMAEMLPGVDGEETLYDIMRKVGFLMMVCLSLLSILLHQYYKLIEDYDGMKSTGPVPFIYRFLFTTILFIVFPDFVMSVMQISDLVRDIIAGGEGGGGYLSMLERLESLLETSITVNAPETEDGFIATMFGIFSIDMWAALFRSFIMRILFYLALAAIYVINISCDLLLGLACAIAPLVFPFCMLPRFGREYWQGLIRTIVGFAMLGPVCALFVKIMVVIAALCGQLGVVAFILVGCTMVGVSSKLVAVATEIGTSHINEGVGRMQRGLASSAKGAVKTVGQTALNGIKKLF